MFASKQRLPFLQGASLLAPMLANKNVNSDSKNGVGSEDHHVI